MDGRRHIVSRAQTSDSVLKTPSPLIAHAVLNMRITHFGSGFQLHLLYPQLEHVLQPSMLISEADPQDGHRSSDAPLAGV